MEIHMSKKWMVLLLGVMTAAMLALSACGSNGGGDDGGGVVGDTGASAPGYSFNYNGTEISMKSPAAPILDALGEAKNYAEETSCAFEGLDKIYFYGSFYLYTYPQGDEDFVNMVELVDDTVTTEEGVSIGDTKEKVEEVYGADSYNGINAYILKSGETTLTIIMNNDKVSSIQYAAVFE